MAFPTAGPFVALTLQPDEPEASPDNPISDGDIALAVLLIVVLGAVIGFDMLRTWWETNRWRRDARRRRRDLQ